MYIELIQGQFGAKDALDIISKMIQVKVRYHESMINKSFNEEDIKFRESKIKQIQNELINFRKTIEGSGGNVKLDAIIKIELK